MVTCTFSIKKYQYAHDKPQYIFAVSKTIYGLGKFELSQNMRALVDKSDFMACHNYVFIILPVKSEPFF